MNSGKLDFCTTTLIEEISNYLDKGFGSYKKSDFEILIFQTLLEKEFIGASNYEISRRLHIPEESVRKLRYLADLKYSNRKYQAENDYRAAKFRALNNLLKGAKYKKENKKIIFSIEDISLRKFLENILKENNSFADSSFNSEIVTISPLDLITILEKFPDGKDTLQKIEKEIESLNITFENGRKATLKDVLLEILQNVTQAGCNITGILYDNFTITGLLSSVPDVLQKIRNHYKQKK